MVGYADGDLDDSGVGRADRASTTRPAAPEGADVISDVDADVVAGKEPPSARTHLTRERIVAAAVIYIHDSGLAGMTMRRLGARLGVEAMALYRYVPGKEDLLDAVVEAIVDRLDEDDDVLVEPTNGWQDFLQRLAHGMRRVALANPKAFPLVASRPPEAPWLRPPLRSLRWVEVFLNALVSEGFDDDSAVVAYRAFSSFLLGHLLLEVSGHGADLGPLDVLTDPEPSGSLADYPTVQRLSGQLAENHAAAEFEDALENLLDRLALLLIEQPPPVPPGGHAVET